MKGWAEDYQTYCADENLFDTSKHTMRVVPCGDRFDLNLRYGVYFHPSGRSYSPHRYRSVSRQGGTGAY
ncbi:hypothetical protein SADO_14604 [Salinisphaera dokdonensis CL-ES53]|uniref:Uncharacterized protein n=2 Tax=Salinisphaera TaxID=180541 RepID=A0ABV2B507_9GAMM